MAYAASKASVQGMTLPMARDLAPYGIRVVAIAPGMFHTPLASGIPQGWIDRIILTVPFPKRWGNPLEFGALVRQIFENSMLNGEMIRIDGAVRLGTWVDAEVLGCRHCERNLIAASVAFSRERSVAGGGKPSIR